MRDMRYPEPNSKIARNFVSYSNIGFKSPRRWLASKQRDDGIDAGLWRVHDDLYDLRPFVAAHPGGQFWLTSTMGTDITEAYETHHLRMSKVNAVLARYLVGPANGPRNVRFTFAEDGFYRTLKRRVVEHLERTDYRQQLNGTNIIVDALLLVTVVLSTVAVSVPYAIFGASVALTLLTIGAHNYVHQADNVRMYYMHLAGLSHAEWRVSHVLSHHLFTNTLLDMEAVVLEPFLSWMPGSRVKNVLTRFASWLYGPLVYALFFAMFVAGRFVGRVLDKEAALVQAIDAIPLLLPIVMYAFNGSAAGVYSVAQCWLSIWCTSSFMFAFIGLNSGHRHPESFHDGDDLGSTMDWGEFQLGALIDRADIQRNHFLGVTQFGDHHLHHLFPALDHNCLGTLYPILAQTAAEFNLTVRVQSWPALIVGQHMQMVRTKPTRRDR